MAVYRIRNTKTGLFSRGGVTPTFSKEGKAWATAGRLKQHLTEVRNHARGKVEIASIYDDCEIVEYSETITNRQPIEDFQSLILMDKMKQNEN